MTDSEREKLIKICEAAVYFQDDPDKKITFELPRETVVSLVSLLKRITNYQCLKKINNEIITCYPRDETEKHIKQEVCYGLANKLVDDNCVTYFTDKDIEYDQTRIMARIIVIKPEG